MNENRNKNDNNKCEWRKFMEDKKSLKLIAICVLVLLVIIGATIAVIFTNSGGKEEVTGGNNSKNGNISGNTNNINGSEGGKGNQSNGGQSNQTSTGLDIELSEDMFIKEAKYTNADKEDESGYKNSVVIDLNNGSPKCSNSSVKIDGKTVTIIASGKYTITGSMEEGQIVVNPSATDEDNVKILLDGVTISNSKNAPFISKAAGKTVITLKDGTENVVNDLRQANTNNNSSNNSSANDASTNDTSSTDIDSTEIEEDNDSGIWCESDLSINGSGKLKVTANYESGIKSKDDLVVYSGEISISAVNNALVGNDSVAIKSGTFSLKADNNGIRCKTNDDASKGYIVIDGGTFDFDVKGSAVKSDFTVIINSGDIKVQAGSDAVHGEYGVQINKGNIIAGKCEEGIEGAYIVINDGEVDITASDDGINASGIGESTDNGFGMDMPNNGQFPDGLQMPENGEMPEGFTKPENGQRPENGQMPENGQFPDGFKMPEDGQFPDGLQFPEDMEIPEGMKPQRPGKDKNSSDSKGNGGVTVKATSYVLNSNMISDTVANAKGGMGGMGGFGVEDASLIINGGTIKINSGGDGLDSNGEIAINGGKVYVNGPTNNGNSPIDAGKGSTINGGEVIIVGSSGMLEAPSDSGKQNCIVVTFNSLEGGSVITVKDEAGNEVMSYESPKAFASLVYSSDKLEKGKTYSVSSGDTVLATLTIDSTVTTSGNMMGGFGGMGGFMR